MPTEPLAHTALLENHPKVEVAPEPVRESARELDTGTIERVLSALEPVDHTTSFEHEPTARLPMLRAEPPVTAGKRRAVKHAGGRGPLFKALPSAPVLLGIAALAVSIGGVVTVNDAAAASSAAAAAGHPRRLRARRLQRPGHGLGPQERRHPRLGAATPRPTPRDEQLQAAAEGLAEERDGALKQLAGAGREAGQGPRQGPLAVPPRAGRS